MVVLIVFAVLVISYTAISALYGWLIMLAVGILACADVIPSTIGWMDGFWLGVVWVALISATAARLDTSKLKR